ncbi:hypothetical protein TEA_000946 [Camellia sinensis var. sinensis]|uniref:Protein kinase domain-containing protein n=1 Tax=Camellia sinensis var. sinensis TaxID=542762 RepID=A0A4S4E7A5_CAMSN|nr:hypothetical protein TEA_000946 [Camellia sinensis var. sinensis]
MRVTITTLERLAVAKGDGNLVSMGAKSTASINDGESTAASVLLPPLPPRNRPSLFVLFRDKPFCCTSQPPSTSSTSSDQLRRTEARRSRSRSKRSMEQTQPPPTSSAAPPASPLIPTNTTTTTTTTTTTPVNTSQPYPDSSPPPLNFSDLERIDPIGKDTGDIDNDNDNSLYSVIHRLTGSFYSLKTISSSSSSSSSSYSQGDPHILRDLEITRALDNPNLVKCHAVFDHGTHIHFLLEYIHGQSLEGIQLNHEPFLSHLTLQILSGLSYLHLRKITHGDIRPSNLLVDLLGRRFKIAYFGLSRITKEIAYMSPERINTDLNRGFYDDVGYAGDIWGIGLCILQLYMGRYPIEVELEDNCPNIASAICLRQPPEAPPTASREFRDFIACCLQSDPAKRWTAHQLLQHPFIRQNASTNKK